MFLFITHWRVRRQVARMLATMPPLSRAVFVAASDPDRSYAEISAALGIAECDVERLFAEGLKHMMRVLGDPTTQRRLAQIREAR